MHVGRRAPALTLACAAGLLILAAALPNRPALSADDSDDCRYYIEYTVFGEGPHTLSADSPAELAERQRFEERWHRWCITMTGPNLTDRPWSLTWGRSYRACRNTAAGRARTELDDAIEEIRDKLAGHWLPDLQGALETLSTAIGTAALRELISTANRPFMSYVSNLQDAHEKLEMLKRDLDFYTRLPDFSLGEAEFYDRLPIIYYENHNASQTLYDRQGRRLQPSDYVETYRGYVLEDARQLVRELEDAQDRFDALPPQYRQLLTPPLPAGSEDGVLSAPHSAPAPSPSAVTPTATGSPPSDEAGGVLVPASPTQLDPAPEPAPTVSGYGFSANVATVVNADVETVSSWASSITRSTLDGDGWSQEQWNRYQSLAGYVLTYKSSMMACFELLDPRFGGLDAAACRQGQAWASAGDMPWELADATYLEALAGDAVSGGQAAPHFLAAIATKAAIYALAFDIMLAEGGHGRTELGYLLDQAVASLDGFDAVDPAEPALDVMDDYADVIRTEVAGKRRQLP